MSDFYEGEIGVASPELLWEIELDYMVSLDTEDEDEDALEDDMPLNDGNALKAISITDDEVRVGNYMVLWGDQQTKDLEGLYFPYRQNPDGTIGEYFTPETKFNSYQTLKGVMELDWEHGRDADVPDSPADETIGLVDLSTVKVDKKGIWVERVLDRSKKYMDDILTFIDMGIIGTSTEPIQSGVVKAPDGRIVRWPLYKDTLTVQPMEWRMRLSDEATVKRIKAVTEEYPFMKSLFGFTSEDELNDVEEPEVDAEEALRLRAELELAQLELDMHSL